MSRTTISFLLAATVYFTAGIMLGVVFQVAEPTRVLRPVHAHINLVGFMTFFVIGVAYHIIPRFRGRPLISERLGMAQFLLANIGLLGMLFLTALDAYGALAGLTYLMALFGAILAGSLLIFVYYMARTLI